MPLLYNVNYTVQWVSRQAFLGVTGEILTRGQTRVVRFQSRAPPLRRGVRNYMIVIIFCRFQSLYKTVDDIDLFPAAMAENPADTDALLGGFHRKINILIEAGVKVVVKYEKFCRHWRPEFPPGITIPNDGTWQ
jgi:hypothetical protein